MNYTPPKTIGEVDAKLMFNEPLPVGDARFVDASKARGDINLDELYRNLGVNRKTLVFDSVRDKNYVLYCGHRGCGKSTELIRFGSSVDTEELFFVVLVDAVVELDINNIGYPDILMALAASLCKKLIEKNIQIDEVHMTNLRTWFAEKTEVREKTKAFASEVKAGIEGKAGIPVLSSIFFKMTEAFRMNSTYKDELRQIIKDGYTQFAGYFNAFIAAAEAALGGGDRPRKILFIVDGTDRLELDKAGKLFIADSRQLQEIRAAFIYCAPIALVYETTAHYNIFSSVILPMIKLHEKGDRTKPFQEGYDAMRAILARRADAALFDSEDTAKYLIGYSGGSPRELMKLLHYAYLEARNDRFDMEAAKKAVKRLSTDYRRILSKADYEILCRYELDPDYSDADNEKVKSLLYNLALLEYNSYWRAPHPVVTLLTEFKNARQALQA